jgi:hypothetical protein
LQEEAPNPLKLRWLRAIGVSIKEEAQQRVCQVRFNEASASEALMRCPPL